MTISVAPGANQRNTHHLKLTQGADSVGLILTGGAGQANRRSLRREPLPQSSLKTYQGQQTHADMEPPWTPITQSDWSGGRGSESFDQAANMYFDGLGVDASRYGEVILAGLPVYMTGQRGSQYWPGVISVGVTPYSGLTAWRTLSQAQSTYKYAIKFYATTNYTVKHVYLKMRFKGNLYNEPFNVSIYDDVGSEPGTSLASKNVDAAIYQNTNSDRDLIDIRASFASGLPLSSGTFYWLVVSFPGVDDDNCWEILSIDNASPSTIYKTYADGVWSNTQYGLIFRLTEDLSANKTLFFHYKKALYSVINYSTGPKVFINGEQGIATGGATTYLDDSTKSWLTDRWDEAYLVLVSGTGSTQADPIRRITGNTSTRITVSPAFDVAPDNTTVYAVIGSDVWTELTGHGLTVTVTDVLSVMNAVYFAQGDSVDIRRMRRYESGTWQTQWAAETGSKGTHLEAVPNESTGALEIWKANRGTPGQIAKAPAVDCSGSGAAAALTFATAIDVGDLAERINGLARYGTSKAHLWVFKEGSIYEVIDDVPAKIPLEEMASAADSRNGKVNLTHNVYLYFSFKDRFQRYYEGRLDDLGPDWRSIDSLYNMRGEVGAAVGYPGRFFIGIDGGSTDYSSVLVNNGAGWHVLWRAPVVGQRITALHIQSLPGTSSPDWLLIGVGAEIVRIPIGINPFRDENFRYTQEGYLVTSWIYASLQDVYKYWSSVKLLLEGMEKDYYFGWDARVNVEYQLDDEESWTAIANVFDDALYQEELISSSYDKYGKRIRFKLRLQTSLTSFTPRLMAMVVEAIARVPYKHVITCTARVRDHDVDLTGQPDLTGADEKLTILKAMAASALPITIASDDEQFNGLRAFMDAVPMVVAEQYDAEGIKAMIIRLRMLEI